MAKYGDSSFPPFMLKEARFSKIIDAVNARKYVSVHTLMALTDSSESTIRADLIELDRQGKLIRLRGGAQALNDETLSYELSVEQKMEIQSGAKKAIALKALTLIRPKMLIYLDAGTSTYSLAEELNVPGVTVITNSVLIARKVMSQGLKAYIVGGEIKLSTDALVGAFAQESVAKFRFDLGFFGANGIDLKAGFTTPDLIEASMKETAFQCCAKAYVLADSTKFDVVTAVSFHPFDPSALITDAITKDNYKNLDILEAKQ